MQMVAPTRQWTLEELHSLPEDGNKYELIRGELFVTPPPTDNHETISARGSHDSSTRTSPHRGWGSCTTRAPSCGARAPRSSRT